MTPSLRQEKTLARRAAFAAREARTDALDAAAVCRQLARFLEGCAPGYVVSFDPMPGECDLRALPAMLPGRAFAWTRTPESGRELSLHPIDAPSEQHRFGYRQPRADAPRISDADVVAVLVPGLAFDRSGGRLGFGKGYYDRLLARLGDASLRVGICEACVVEAVPMGPHDVRMTHLADAAGVLDVRAT